MAFQDSGVVPKVKTKSGQLDEDRMRRPLPDFVKFSLTSLPSLTLVPKLVAESSLDRVGGAGGLRLYLPARMAKDRQFPFRPGELARMMVILDGQGREVGLILAKKAFLEEFETVTKTWAED